MFLCVPMFLLYSILSIFFGMFCHHIAGKMFVALDTYTLLSMMKMDFWGFKHGSSQSFNNKCDCAWQVNPINVKMITTLLWLLKRFHVFLFPSSNSPGSPSLRSISLLGLAASTCQQEKGQFPH